MNLEAAYERLAGYGFARRLVQGKVVANVAREGVGQGSLLLAQSAESVVGLGDLHAAVEAAALSHPAPNLSYRHVDLPDLALPDGSVDAVVALGVLGEVGPPEDLVREAGRVLREGGVLIVSVPDRQTNANERRGIAGGVLEMHVSEFRELLGRHFEHLRLYRQGAVAGGMVFPDSGEVTGAEVEGARVRPAYTLLGAETPTTRTVVAVCSDRPLGGEDGAYVLLDRDRGVFDESAERAEDVGLLREEIRQMQETEAQAFLDALRSQRRQNLSDLQKHYLFILRSVLHHLRNMALEETACRRNAKRHLRNVILERAVHRYNVIFENIRHRRNVIHGNIRATRSKDARSLARGALRRPSHLYRRLRAENGNHAWKLHSKKRTGGTPNTDRQRARTKPPEHGKARSAFYLERPAPGSKTSSTGTGTAREPGFARSFAVVVRVFLPPFDNPPKRP